MIPAWSIPSLCGGVGADLAVRATPENPSFDLNSSAAWDLFLGGAESNSGVVVNCDTALEYAPWWRGVHLLANYIAKTPLYVYRRVGEGKDRDPKHPAYRSLRRKPNPFQTAFVFRQQGMGHLLSHGNFYAAIMKRRPNVELWPLDPNRTYPVRDVETGEITYILENDRGPALTLRPDEVFHVKGLGYDGLVGYDVIEYHRNTIGLGIAEARYCETLYKNGVRPSVVLEAPSGVSEEQIKNLRDSWDKLYAGVENMHKTILLTQGVKANSLTFSAQDAQTKDMRQMSAIEVALVLGLPTHKLGDPTRTAYASLEQENQSLLDDTVDPWFVAWESESWDKLLSDEEKDNDTHTIEFLRQSLVQADMKTKAVYFRTATGGRPWMTPDEVRGAENLNPLGGDAAELLTPMNFGQGGAMNDPATATGSDNGDTADGEGDLVGGVVDAGDRSDPRLIEASRMVMQSAERRAMKRLTTHAVKAAKSPRSFLDWLDGLHLSHGPAVRQILAPAYDLAKLVNVLDDKDARVVELVEAVRSELLELSGRVKGDQLSKAVSDWARSRSFAGVDDDA